MRPASPLGPCSCRTPLARSLITLAGLVQVPHAHRGIRRRGCEPAIREDKERLDPVAVANQRLDAALAARVPDFDRVVPRRGRQDRRRSVGLRNAGQGLHHTRVPDELACRLAKRFRRDEPEPNALVHRGGGEELAALLERANGTAVAAQGTEQRPVVLRVPKLDRGVLGPRSEQSAASVHLGDASNPVHVIRVALERALAVPGVLAPHLEGVVRSA
mmetsp:Transcript_8196/g.26035  ORF Transcript_8196/g.26035 Transcript_8196/m.26035 type:complete len:217 (+) Transcript_8196:124-774(+)